MLNARGGIESDLTVTRLSETAFLLVVPGATLQRDLAWLRRHLGDDVRASSPTSRPPRPCSAVMGPKARDLLSDGHARTISPTTRIPFGTGARSRSAWASRARTASPMSANSAGSSTSRPIRRAHVFETLEEAGADLGLKLCGLHALDCCRIEKAYRHFGHDITDEDHVLEAGLGFAVKTGKGDFIGRDAVLRKREAGLNAPAASSSA